MNSPPYHYYHHYYHDPTIITTHTLLNPHAYQQPTHNTYSATAQYSHSPFSHHQPTYINTKTSVVPASASSPISTTDIKFLLNQLLQSQENFKHTLSLFANEVSLFANEVSLLKTTLTPSSPHTITQQQTYTPLHQQPTPSLHHTVDSVFHVDENEKVLISDPVTKIIKEIAPMTNLLPEHSPPSLVISLPPPPHISLSAVSKPTFTTEVVANYALSISEATRFTPYSLSLRPNFEQSFCTSTTSLPEKEVVRAVEVTHQQQPHLTFELLVVPIHVFDPGGTLTIAVNSAARRRQIRFTSCNVLFHLVVRNRLPLSAFINDVAISSFDASPNLHGFRFVVFDPGGDESRFRSPTAIPATVSLPVRGAALGEAFGRPWVWIQKHKCPRGCIDVFDPGGDESTFRFPALMFDTNASSPWVPWDRGEKLRTRQLCPVAFSACILVWAQSDKFLNCSIICVTSILVSP